jgi:1,6-anhydro-N-acetylmuramate kinase
VDSIYIGLMTGTSADSLDCAAVNFSKKEMNIIGLKNYDIPNVFKIKIQESTQALELDESLLKELDINPGKFFFKEH